MKTGADGVRRLAGAFVSLAMEDPRLDVQYRQADYDEKARATVAEHSLVITLTAPGARGEVVLRLGPRRARLTARSRPLPGSANVVSLRDDLSIVLAESLRWGTRIYVSADDMARDFTSHMRRRLETVLEDPLAGTAPRPAPGRAPARLADCPTSAASSRPTPSAPLRPATEMVL